MFTPASALLVALSSAAALPQDARETGRNARSADSTRTLGATSRSVAHAAMMPWQRNLDDALALVESTGKPLLICVNMDGEAASESLANSRYRDPKFLELVSGFVPVLASPSRHHEADYGNRGWRLSDPKFGRLVESEHIDHEPRLYERYFSGNRVAPRHVGVAPDGTILFDLFLLRDLGIIDRTLKQYGKFDVPPLNVEAMSQTELLESPDASARARLEREFIAEEDEMRERLASLAFSVERPTQHPEIIRLALRDRVDAVRMAAVHGVAERVWFESNCDGPVVAIPFLPDAFRVAREFDGLRDKLIGSVRELSTSTDSVQSNRGRRLLEIFKGLSSDSSVVDVDRWMSTLAVTADAEAMNVEVETPTIDELSERLSALDSEIALDPNDLVVNLTFAEQALQLADLLLSEGGGNPSFVLEDGAAAAERALIGGPNATASALLARAKFLLGEVEAAGEAAAEALPGLVGLGAAQLVHDVLDCLVQARVRAIYDRISAESEIPPAWISDAYAAYRVLAAHPRATEQDVVVGLEFMGAIEALAEQTDIVRRAVVNIPTAGQMHLYLRHCVLRDEGIEALSAVYDELDVPEGFEAAFDWHAGLANMVAGETLGRDGRLDESVETYDVSIRRFLESIEESPDYAPSANHYLVLAHAGLARRLAEMGDLDGAMHEIRTAAALVPSSFAETDGLGRMPRDTVRDLLRSLRLAGRREDADRLKADLEAAKVRF